MGTPLALQAGYPGIDGFLGTRGSVMLDVVFLAMFLIVPVLAASIVVVRRGRLQLHKRIQVALTGLLLVAVTLFEIDVRFVSGWRQRAEPSPYFGGESGWGAVEWVLAVHLVFAISTTLLWTVVFVRAWRNFPASLEGGPHPHARSHVRWAWLASLDMGLTAITGCTFYWLAFVASNGS